MTSTAGQFLNIAPLKLLSGSSNLAVAPARGCMLDARLARLSEMFWILIVNGFVSWMRLTKRLWEQTVTTLPPSSPLTFFKKETWVLRRLDQITPENSQALRQTKQRGTVCFDMCILTKHYLHAQGSVCPKISLCVHTQGKLVQGVLQSIPTVHCFEDTLPPSTN